MSVDEVEQTRTIEGFEITIKRYGPMGIIASNIVAKEISAFIDKIERALEYLEVLKPGCE